MNHETSELISRRRFLLASAAGAVSQFLPGDVFASQEFWSMPRWLWIHRPATNEQVRVVYFADGKVVPKGYAAICSILRDVRANETIPMDLVLLDVLCGMQGIAKTYGISQPFWATSGHRNNKTNSLTEGAAKDSRHEKGQALDGRIPGVTATFTSRVALALNAGGVGYYEDKNFTHIDTGRVRFWRG